MKHTVCTAALVAALFTAPALADMHAGIKALEARERKAAISHFEANLENANTAFDAHWRLGETLVKAGEPKEALDYLEKAVEMNPDHAEAHYWWGAANGQTASNASIFSAPGYAKKCREAFERVLELDPGHMEAREGLIQFHLSAPGIVGGDRDRARQVAAETLDIDRKRGLVFTAMVQFGTDETEKALETWGTLISEYPKEPRPYLDRGLTLREMGRYDEAMADLKTLSELTPVPTGDEEKDKGNKLVVTLGHYFLGSVASRSGRFHTEGVNALEAYLQAGEFDHSLRKGYAHYYLADIYLAAGDVEKAAHHADLAEESEQDKDLKKLIKRLRKAIRKA